MDRKIVYPGAIPLETDLLTTNRDAMVALAVLSRDILGSSTVAGGLACSPTATPSLGVTISAGSIYSIQNIDGNPYSTLGTDTSHQILKQGISLDPVTLACPAPATTGLSVNYLIEAAFQEVDASSVVLPYYNVSNPVVAYSGPANSGSAQATHRLGTVLLQAKAGTPAASGTQTSPSADTGFVGLWVVTVANGQATIASGNIAQAAGAPFILTLTALVAKLASGAGGYSVGYGNSTVGAALDAISPTVANLAAIDSDALQEFGLNLAAGISSTAACFGDSTMYGIDGNVPGLGTQVAVPPPQELQNFVNNYLGMSSLTVTNNGISGTTCSQMIAGTDGSGSTFAAKMAVSSASVIFCNHGVNDANGTNSTTGAAYRLALLAFVSICRLAGKTPVLVTPHPCLTIGALGSQARAQATASFAAIMREVARCHGVALVDTNYVLASRMNVDGVLPLTVLVDGVHGSQPTYTVTGNQLAQAFLGSQSEFLLAPGQRIPASSSAIRASGQTISQSSSSRVGAVSASGTVTPQTLRMVFQVTQPGLDVVLSHPIYNLGSPNIDVNFDGVSIGSLSMYSAGFPVSGFWQDFETVLVRNVPIGMHILTFTTSSSGGIGVYALRARATEKPLMLPNGFASPLQGVILSPSLSLISSGANTLIVCDTMPASRFLDNLDLQWTSQMLKSSAVIVGGNVGSNTGTASAERAISIGLNANGFVQVDECTGSGAYASTILNAADLSAGTHTYRAVITPAGTVTVAVDGAVLASTATLTNTYKGGLVGLYKGSASSTLTVTNLTRNWVL